VKGRGSLIIF